MGLINNVKRDIARHRGRSAVLGVLFVAMVLFSIRAVIQLRPPPLAAAVPAALQTSQENRGAGSEAQTRLKESQALWATLREVKGGAAGANVAFTFDSSLYPPPPQDMIHKPATPDVDPAKVAVPAMPPAESQSGKETRIREQARSLIVKSTAVGDGIAQPVAIINQKLLTVGQDILGFSITAIRAREVEFIKEGVPVIIKMSDGQ